jgi:hypothetical protein
MARTVPGRERPRTRADPVRAGTLCGVTDAGPSPTSPQPGSPTSPGAPGARPPEPTAGAAPPAVQPFPTPPAVPAGGGADDLALPDAGGSWALDLAAATLNMDTADTDALFEALGSKLERILGTRVQIQRDGGFRRKHRIGKIVVDTGEGRLEATRSRTGPVFLLVHAVRGITLQTAEIAADEWLDRLVAMVGKEAVRSNDVRSALGRLLDT